MHTFLVKAASKFKSVKPRYTKICGLPSLRYLIYTLFHYIDCNFLENGPILTIWVSIEGSWKALQDGLKYNTLFVFFMIVQSIPFSNKEHMVQEKKKTKECKNPDEIWPNICIFVVKNKIRKFLVVDFWFTLQFD